jgi:hypothetical protein
MTATASVGSCGYANIINKCYIKNKRQVFFEKNIKAHTL